MAVPTSKSKGDSDFGFDFTPRPIFQVTKRKIGQESTIATALGAIGDHVSVNMPHGEHVEGHYETVVEGFKVTVTFEEVS